MISVHRLCALAALAGVALVVSADLVSAGPARVSSNTNLRQGPGTDHAVITTVPGGSIVEVTQCAAEWCTAHWHGRVGYMIATHLDQRPVPVAPRVVVYSDPLIYGPPYFYGPRFFVGYGYGYHYRRHFRRW